MNSATAIGIFTTSGVGMFVFAISRTGPQPASVTQQRSALKPQMSGARKSGGSSAFTMTSCWRRLGGAGRRRLVSTSPIWNGDRERSGSSSPTKVAAVALTQYAHQGRKPDAGVLRGVGPYWKTDSMNTHATLAGFILAIDDVHALDDRVDRRSR